MQIWKRQCAEWSQNAYEALRSLGYYNIKTEGKTGEWQRRNFQLYTYPWRKRGIKLSLHEDVWKQPAPIFKHEAENKGRDIEEELQRIREKYRKVIRGELSGNDDFSSFKHV